VNSLELPPVARLSYGGFLDAMASKFNLLERVTFVEAHLTEKTLVETLQGKTDALNSPLDLVFSDYVSSAPGVYETLGALLPYMSDRGSIFLDAIPTRFETYLSLERAVEQLNAHKIPQTISAAFPADHCEALVGMLRKHQLRVIHIVERKRRAQNSTAWVRIEPIDLIPFGHELLSW
jgi:hypothetical protein